MEYRSSPLLKAIHIILSSLWVTMGVLNFLIAKSVFTQVCAALYCLTGIAWFIIFIPRLRRIAYVIGDNGLIIHCMWLRRRTIPWRDVKGVRNVRRCSAVLYGNFPDMKLDLGILSKRERANFIDQVKRCAGKGLESGPN